MGEDNGRLNFGVGFNVYDGEGDLGKLTQKIEELNKAAKSAAQALTSIEQGAGKMSNGVKEVTNITSQASTTQDDFAKTIKTAWDSGTLSAAQALEMLKPKIEEYEKQVKSAKEAAGDGWINDEDIKKADKELSNLKTTFTQIEKVAISSSDKIKKYSKETFQEISQKDKQEMQERVRNSQQETYEKNQELDKQSNSVKNAVSTISSHWKTSGVTARQALSELSVEYKNVYMELAQLKGKLGSNWGEDKTAVAMQKQLNTIRETYNSISNTVKTTEDKIKQYNQNTTDDVSNMTKSEMADKIASYRKIEQENKESLKQQNADYKVAMADMKAESEATSTSISDDMQSRVGNLKNSFKSLGLQTMGIYALVNAFEDLGRTVVDVNYNATNNMRLMGEFSDELRSSMNDSAVSMAKSTGILVTDAQEIQGAWIRINEKYAESRSLLNKISEATAKFMNVGEIEDADEAVKLLNASMLQFGLTVDEGIETLNKWVFMADKTAMGTADEFGEAISKFGGALASANGNMDDAIVLTSLLGDKLAKSGDEAGTSLKTITTYLYRDKTRNFFDDLAESTGDASLRIVDAEGKFKDFRSTLTMMSEQYNKAIAEGNDLLAYQIRQTLGATRQADSSIAILESYSTTAQDYYDTLQDSAAQGTAYLDQQNEILMTTFKNQWNSLYATITDFGTTLANSGILSGLTGIMSVLDGLISGFNNLDPVLQKSITSLAGIAIAFGALKKISSVTGLLDKWNASVKIGTNKEIEYAEKMRVTSQAYYEQMNARRQANMLTQEETTQLQISRLAFDKITQQYKEGKINAKQYSDALRELKTSQLAVTETAAGAAAEELVNNTYKKAGVEVIKEETAAKTSGTLATVAHTVATTVSTAAQKAFNIAKQTALSLFSIGNIVMLAATVIISAIYGEYKKLQNATEDQAQYLEDVRSKYDEIKNEVDELNKKKADGTITADEEKRLATLESQLKTEQELLAIEEKKAAHNAVFGANWTETQDSIHEKTKDQIKSLEDEVNKYNDEAETINSLSDEYKTLQQNILEAHAKGEDTSKYEARLAAIGSELNTVKKSHEETTASVKENKLQLTQYRDGIQEYIDKGLLTADEVDEVSGTLQEATDDIDKVTSYIGEYGDEVDIATQKVEDLASEQSNLNDSLSEIQDELDDLNDVIDIYNENGYLSAEQASDLCQKNEDYAKYLVKTADGYELTSDAIDRRNVLEGDQADTVDLLIEKTNDHEQAVKDQQKAIEDKAAADGDAANKSTDAANTISGNQTTIQLGIAGTTSAAQESNGLLGEWFSSLGDWLSKADEANRNNKINTDEIDKYWSDLGTSIKQGWSDTFDGIGRNLSGFGESIKTSLEDVDTNFSNWVDQKKVDFSNWWDDMSTDAQATWNGMWDAISTGFWQFVDGLTAPLTSAINIVSGSFGIMDALATGDTESLRTNVNKVWDNLSPDAQSKLQPMKDQVDKQFGDSKKSAEDNTREAHKSVIETWGAVTTDTDTELGNTRTKVSGRFGDMVTDINGKRPDFEGAGLNIVAGLNLGLKDENENPANTIWDICKKMLQNVIDYFVIKSPSHKMREMGGYIIKGLANGLMDTNMVDVVDKVMSGIGDAFASGSGNIMKILEVFGTSATEVFKKIGVNFAGIGGGLTSSGLTFPTDSKTITSWFGYRNDTGGVGSTYHQGIDIGAGMGEPIYAAMAGTVTTAGAYGGYGNAVIIDHGNGLQTLYGHQSAVAVGSGQHVAQGQVIGYVGSTGNSTGPHLHFSIMVNGEMVDPTMFLGSFAVGTTNIDHDGYAMLHEGEGVLTKAENATLKTLSALVMGVPDPSTADSNNTTKYPEGSTTTYNINKVSYDKNYSSEKSSYNKQKSSVKSGTDEEKEKEKTTIESTTKTFTSNVTSLMSKITSALKEKYTKLHNERIKQLEKERDEQLKVHDERIDYLNAEIEKLQGDTIEDKEGNLDKLKSSLERWMLDDSTVGKAKQKELYDQIIDLEKEIKIDKLQAEIDAEEAIKDAISEDYTNATDEESSSYDSVLAELDKKMSDKYLADEASSLIVNNKLNEITQLLGEFSPDYNNLAYIMGDSAGNIIAKEVNEQLNNYKDLLYNTISSLGGVSTNAGSSTGVKETITKFASGGHVGNSEGLAYIDVKERILSAQQTAAFDKFVYDIMPTIDKNLVSTSVTDTNTNISKDVNFNKEFVSVKVGKIENHTNQDVKDMENGLNKLIKTNLRKSGVNIIT